MNHAMLAVSRASYLSLLASRPLVASLGPNRAGEGAICLGKNIGIPPYTPAISVIGQNS